MKESNEFKSFFGNSTILSGRYFVQSLNIEQYKKNPVKNYALTRKYIYNQNNTK